MGQKQNQECGLRSPGRGTDPDGGAGTVVDRDANPEEGLEEAGRWGSRAVGLIDLSEWTRPSPDLRLLSVDQSKILVKSRFKRKRNGAQPLMEETEKNPITEK